jgi:cell wall-associated NlpC family hydrolase
MMRKYLLITLLSTSLFANIVLTKGAREASALDSMPSNEVQDTLSLPQDTKSFVKGIELMSAEEQLRYDRDYNEKFFEPWQLIEMDLTESEKRWQFKYAKEKTYRRSGRRISKKWFDYQIENSNFDAYNSVAQPAITVRHSDIKLYPSKLEIFYDPNRTGEGFPFDYNQNSAIYLNTPIFVSHYSKDKKWVYVKSAFAFGWLPIEDIAFVTSDFQAAFQNGNYAITVTDNLNLMENKHKISLVKMGTIFPIDRNNTSYLFAGRDSRGYAYMRSAKATEINLIADKPIKFNPFNIAYIGKELIGEPYGWGGKLEARDCSALTRDFFAPFGLYLPRNSTQQAKESGGEYISLKGLSEKERKEAIVRYAKPFRSLLYVPGHVMLYLGVKNGEPIILHNYWGVRLKSGKKHILGRAIVTTTHPGAERKDIKRSSMLSNTLSGVVNF